MKHLLKVTAMVIILVGYGCQENSSEVNLEKNAWNWSVNRPNEEQHLALMVDALMISRFKNARENFLWLIEENPKLHPSIYEYGLAIYQGLIDESQDQATQHALKIEMEKIAKLKEKYFP